jgi:hypothetical protein
MRAAPLEHLQGVADGLPRHAQHGRDALLRQLAPGRQRAVRDGAEQAVVHLVDEGGLDVDLAHRNATPAAGFHRPLTPR